MHTQKVNQVEMNILEIRALMRGMSVISFRAIDYTLFFVIV
jgi:hypothetical protein